MYILSTKSGNCNDEACTMPEGDYNPFLTACMAQSCDSHCKLAIFKTYDDTNYSRNAHYPLYIASDPALHLQTACNIYTVLL